MDLRQSVLEYVKKADNRFLRLVMAMAENYHEKDDIAAYTVDGKPLTLEQYNQELFDAEAEIKRGETVTVEELEKKMFNTIEIDRNNLTIMGVKFSDLKTLESTANALGSNMFEGFKPTPKGIEIIRDYVTGKISLVELVEFAKEKSYV